MYKYACSGLRPQGPYSIYAVCILPPHTSQVVQKVYLWLILSHFVTHPCLYCLTFPSPVSRLLVGRVGTLLYFSFPSHIHMVNLCCHILVHKGSMSQAGRRNCQCTSRSYAPANSPAAYPVSLPISQKPSVSWAGLGVPTTMPYKCRWLLALAVGKEKTHNYVAVLLLGLWRIPRGWGSVDTAGADKLRASGLLPLCANQTIPLKNSYRKL